MKNMNLLILMTAFSFAGCSNLDNSMFIPAFGTESGGSTEITIGSDIESGLHRDEVPDGTLKVMSFNVRVGSADNKTPNAWVNRRKAAANLIYKENPTVFGVQEALMDQLVYIRQQAPEYGDVGVGRDDGRQAGEHMNIFYNKNKAHLQDWGYFWLSETPEKPSYGWGEAYRRLAVWGIFTDIRSGKDFFYLNTHCPLDNTANANALSLIMEKIAEFNPRNLPVVISADFNIGQDSHNFAVVREKCLNARETAESTDNLGTFNGFGTGSAVIDHIWYSGFAAAKSYRTITEQYCDTEYVSDHYPISAVLVF